MACSALARALSRVEFADGRAWFLGGRSKRVGNLRTNEQEVASIRGSASTEAELVEGKANIVLEKNGWRTEGVVEKVVRLLIEAL